MTKQQFDEHVEILKELSVEKFNSVIEYNEEEIDNWLIDYSIKNQDIKESIHGIYHDLTNLEGELFYIKIRHEINVVPMKNYIEDWFKRAIDKLTKEGQETVSKENKRTTERK
jgi:hypothetical protein